MALLQLQDIGKIYVSEGNVTVGIRGVNLSFDKGEFVAITGKSGSGKSTLLNVISGMDTYEEGELLIEGQPTSHYLQPEWEEYREKYISFIFQDYNIIDSFTVLQNVELALLYIEDHKMRRARALELIDRVGLSKHVKQKGSQLSGGQKQRTVIARALAKNSPIILADEPTGNLDSQTSKEIISLLREVSKEKLLIVVTHNFEEVEACATRHVRIFDSAVESDRVLEQIPPPLEKEVRNESKKPTKREEIARTIKNGFLLGKNIFLSKPRLSFFLCLLMMVGSLGMFFITSFFSAPIMDAFAPNYMFVPMEGRLIVTANDGSPISQQQLEEIAEEQNATYYLRNDKLLDSDITANLPYDYFLYQSNVDFLHRYDTKHIEGRLPEAENEIVLYLPISYKKNKTENILGEISLFNDFSLNAVGVLYYYDNNLNPKILLTQETYDLVAPVCSMQRNTYTIQGNAEVEITEGNFSPILHGFLTNYSLQYSFDVPEGQIYLCDVEHTQILENVQNLQITLFCQRNGVSHSIQFSQTDILFEKPDGLNDKGYHSAYINIHTFQSLAEQTINESYRQCSLFFENDDLAKIAAERLQEQGFIAVLSNSTYEDFGESVIGMLVMAVFMIFLWFLTILFLAFFINLCTARSMESFKNELAIMRSMGIRVNVVKIAIYARMLIALLPAYATVIVTAISIFVSPTANALFTFLYPWQYVALFIGLLILSIQVTRKQLKKLFDQSVKKSLKGGGVA